MPAMTGLSPVFEGRPGGEAQVGVMPGYFLSDAVREQDPEGAGIQQALLMVEPGRAIGVPGLSLGTRFVGKKENGGYLEPMLRYRLALDDGHRASLGLTGYGTRASGSLSDASYSATRSGLELGLDVRLTPETSWGELHFVGVAAATALVANGEYCTDEEGRFGVDCPDSGDPRTRQRAEVSGLYPALGASLALDFSRRALQAVHAVRLAIHVAAGTLPRVELGQQRHLRTYGQGGVSLSMEFGAAR